MFRTIDPTLPREPENTALVENVTVLENDVQDLLPTSGTQEQVSPSILPLPYSVVPSHVQNLRDCALWQIQFLQRRAAVDNISTSSSPVEGEDAIFLQEEEEDALDDGFVLCDLNVIRHKLVAWRRLFPRIKPFYAVKCNPDVMVAAVLGQCFPNEAGFDCASLSEINLALRSSLGYQNPQQNFKHETKPEAPIINAVASTAAKRCIYANPQRDEKALHEALRLGVEALTFDGSEELRKVHDAHQRRVTAFHKKQQKQPQQNHESSNELPPPPPPPEMVLRILVPDGSSSVPLGEKFGAPPARVASLTEEAYELGLPVVGVSFHCGSGCHDAQAYETAIRLGKRAMDDINQVYAKKREGNQSNNGFEKDIAVNPCRLLDIGGGYPGADGLLLNENEGNPWRFSGGPASNSEANQTLENPSEKTVTAEVDQPPPSPEIPEETTSAADIARVVKPLVDDLFPPSENDNHDKNKNYIIAEPGRYFVEEAFALCSRIYSVREETLPEAADHDGVGGTQKRTRMHYYIGQGVQGMFKDVLLCGETFLPIPLRVASASTAASNMPSAQEEEEEEEGAALLPSMIHGPSGEEFDLVNQDCRLPRLMRGDWLLFDRMGAYTLSISSRGGGPPVRYVVGGGGCVDAKGGGKGGDAWLR